MNSVVQVKEKKKRNRIQLPPGIILRQATKRLGRLNRVLQNYDQGTVNTMKAINPKLYVSMQRLIGRKLASSKFPSLHTYHQREYVPKKRVKKQP